MIREYTALGLMSGTSGDGVDASIIKSDGKSKYKVISNKYFEYDMEIYEGIHNLKEKIQNTKDLENHYKDLKNLEKKITIFHSKVTVDICKNKEIDNSRFSWSNYLSQFSRKNF